MIDYAAYTDAVALVRASGLIPTQARIMVARLLLDSGRRSSLDDLIEQAAEDGLHLSRDTVARTLGLLTGGGAAPQAQGRVA